MPTYFQQEAQRIIEILAFTPFDKFLKTDRKFAQFPARPGIYSVRHRIEGLLYLGKTNDLSSRSNGGHKAFTWAWLDLYPPRC